MDYIPEGMSPSWLKSIFEKDGLVEDVVIAKIARKHINAVFGFVRFSKFQDAKKAINRLNGFAVRGAKLRVSMAKYNRDGSVIKKQKAIVEETSSGFRMINTPSFTDQRKYSEVLMGKQSLIVNETRGLNVIPLCFTMNAVENEEIFVLLNRAIIAENTEVINLAQAEIEVSANVNSVKGMCSLSPTKILIVFESLKDAVDAVSGTSVLWNVFDDIRMWSEGEMFDDRLV